MSEERYLRRTGGRAGDYFDRPFDPLRAGEALDRDELELLTERARRARQAHVAAEWVKASARVGQALQHFETVGQPPRDLERSLRAIARCVSAVDRQLGV